MIKMAQIILSLAESHFLYHPPPFISMLLYSLHFHSGFASNTLLLELKYFRMKSFSQIGVSEFLLFFSTISGMEVMSFFSLSVSLVRRIGDLGEE